MYYQSKNYLSSCFFANNKKIKSILRGYNPVQANKIPWGLFSSQFTYVNLIPTNINGELHACIKRRLNPQQSTHEVFQCEMAYGDKWENTAWKQPCNSVLHTTLDELFQTECLSFMSYGCRMLNA